MAPHRVAAAQSTYAVLGTATLASATAALASFAMALLGDPFTWAWLMLVVASGLDYALGVASARMTPPGQPGAYDPDRRARGQQAKITRLILMLGMRSMEGWATAYGLLNVPRLLAWLGLKSDAAPPGGLVSAIITMLLVLGELASIYGRYKANGGEPILALELLFNGMEAAQRKVFGRAARATAAWAGKDAEAFEGVMRGLRKTDDDGYARAHDGEPAPRRRHTDVALVEMEVLPPENGEDR